jgi:hypothetical protein
MEKYYLKHKHGAATLARMPAAEGAAHHSRSRQRQKLVSPTRGPLGSGEGRVGGILRGAKRKMAAEQTVQLWQVRQNPVQSLKSALCIDFYIVNALGYILTFI